MYNSHRMQLAPDTKAVLLADSLMFLFALLLGVWKYRQIVTSPEHRSHVYADIAHRAALLYSFALLLVATFVQLSDWSAAVNLVAAGAMGSFFFISVANYVRHAVLDDTDNQFRDGGRGTQIGMHALIVAEIGGWLVLTAGFVAGQIL
jgi:hypothetical protein